MALDYTKIANKLKLNPMASEEAIIEEIASIVNKKNESDKKAEDAEDKMKKMEEDLKKAKKDYDDKKAEYDSLKKDYDDMKKKNDDDEEDKKNKKKAEDVDKAKNMVEGFAKEGRIPSDAATMKAWQDKAVADYEGIKNLLGALPINKKATTIPVSGNPTATNDKALTSVISNKMADLRKKTSEA